MPEINKVLEKYHLKLSRKGQEIILRPAQVSRLPYFIKEFNSALSYLNEISHNSLYSLKIHCLPYCLLPQDISQRNIYYLKNSKYRYFKPDLCLNCKYEKFCPGIIENLKNSLKVNPIADIPLEIIIQATKRCNLNCKICAGGKNNAKSLPFSKIKNIIDEARRLNIEAIRFTGGEPFIREDIEKLIIYAKSKGFYIIINTNGSLIEKKISFMEKYVDNVLVSFQGCNAKLEKIFTDKDDLIKKRFKNMLALNNSAIPMVRSGTIISNYLINYFDKYLKIIEALNVRHWELYRPMIKKENLNYYPEYDINPDKFRRFLDIVYRARTKKVNIFIANPVPFCVTKKIKKIQPLFLGATFDEGHSRLFYDSNGYFKPNYFLDINIGATIKQALGDPFLKKIKSLNYLPRKCKVCQYLKDCRGGSRYIAYEFNGGYYKTDPWMNMNNR